MTDESLIVLLAGAKIGIVRRDRGNRLTFVYDEKWRNLRDALPLSLSMPLAAAEHGHTPIEAFIWGLLPDNELILDRWARRFHVSARNPFALIANVGEDCAGAVQFARPDRLDTVTTTESSAVDWIDEGAVAERLRQLKADHSAWRAQGDIGQFSLAGAQPKIALLYENGRWGIPSGRTPTTHIIKPQIGDFDGHAVNEHICLGLARELGLPATGSELRRFDDEWAIVVERYDRAYTSGLAAAESARSAAKAAEAAAWAASPDDTDAVRNSARAASEAVAAAARASGLSALAETQPILRLHQEDMCQALGLPPTAKYQNDRGPSPERICRLLADHSSRPHEDIRTFVDALAFNWLIARTDGHAKNTSILHGGGGRVRLAPLYDLASVLPYPEFDVKAAKLAMKIGGQYRLRDIGPRQWRAFAEGINLDANATIDRVAELASRLPEATVSVRDRIEGQGWTHPMIDRLAKALTDRANECLRQLGVEPTR